VPDTVSVQVLPYSQAVLGLEKHGQVVFAEPQFLSEFPPCERGVKASSQCKEHAFCRGAGCISLGLGLCKESFQPSNELFASCQGWVTKQHMRKLLICFAFDDRPSGFTDNDWNRLPVGQHPQILYLHCSKGVCEDGKRFGFEYCPSQLLKAGECPLSSMRQAFRCSAIDIKIGRLDFIKSG